MRKKNERFKCDQCQCPTSFYKKERLIEHLALKHNGEKPYACAVCNKKFSELKRMNYHQKAHSKHNSKRFYCDECPASYQSNYNLTQHKRSHTGEKPYACAECGEKYNTQWNLREHTLRVHCQEKNYICDICQSAFSTRRLLYCHRKKTHNAVRHPCSECRKSFACSSDLRTHFRIHTGEKPYVCDICSASFAARQNYNSHWKKHLGDAIEYSKCEYCYKKFLNNIDRDNHMRSHTEQKPVKTAK